MCGIFGYSFKHGKLSAARRAVLATNLARYNDYRGGDSWGVVGINNEGPHIARGLGDLSDSAYELCEYQTLFAHTRAASSGEVNLKNAHPFRVGKILGAHNGAVYNHDELCEQYKRNFSVDSIHLFAHLNENRPFSELVARGAIEWIHLDNPKTIYLSKLFSGDLSVWGIGTEEDCHGVVWSSDYKHLLKALFCAGLHEHFRYEVRKGRVYFVNNGVFGKVNDMKLQVTEPVFRRADPVHFSLDNDGKVMACNAPEAEVNSWTVDKASVSCTACEAAINKEAPPSDEAGAIQFRKKPTDTREPSGRTTNAVTLWRAAYGQRADI